jgi:C_GCAxxG_C_C family probable redox protein
MNTTEKKELAMRCRKSGYNCAQSVIMAFADEAGIDESTAAKIGNGLGGGVGAQGDICGVVLGMSIVDGLMRSFEASAKVNAYAATRALTTEFEQRHAGCRLCRDLKAAKQPCDKLVEDGVEILCQHLQSK